MTAINITTLPLSQLRIDEKANVRKIGRGAEASFIASIKALGVKQPLIVRPNGSGHVVTDGGKRLAALQALAKTGDVPADHPVPVIVENVNDAVARETSLSLNVIRADMHPVDEFRAFHDLHTLDKLSVEEIATRYGINIKHVEQRLALGALDPVILDAWRDGKVNADVAKAFTLCTSRKQQVAIFTTLQKRRDLDPASVRRKIAGLQHNVAKLISFVGAAAYEKQGGKITRDLFGGEPVASDWELLNKMVQAKLGETVEQLKKDGWSFVLSERPNNVYDYRVLEVQLKPTAEEKKKLDAKEKELKQLNKDGNWNKAWSVERELDDMKEQVRAHSFTEQHKAKSGCIVTFDPSEGIEISYGRTKPAPRTEAYNPRTGRGEKKKVKVPGVAQLSNALVDRLRMQRMKALKSALVAHPWGNDFASMLATIVASQINDKTMSEHHIAPTAVASKLDAITQAIAPKVLNAALRKAFDAKDYFENAPKPFALAAITEAVNADESRKLAGKKRPEIAKFAIANVPAKGWLPKELRTSHYDGPQKKGGGAESEAAKLSA